ncbi:MAG: hypothetical protein HYX78_12385 [Armatimonadetes bacterium]|nr:hypothetical protein [Armatimonadota bacterium]
MYVIRKIGFAAILAALLLGFLAALVLANGEVQPAEQPKPAAAPAEEAAPPPAGRGPAEAAEAISIAPISAIRQRGHVANECEALTMLRQSIAESGGQNTFGDYQVAYMLDPPLGYYEMADGRLTWRPPAPGETQHIEAVVMDSLTGQPLPITPTVEVVDQQGSVVQSKQLVYYWHPMAGHYGANFSVPTAGSYTLRVRAPAPDFRRHDRTMGERFTAPLDASFTDVRISPKAPPSAAPEAVSPPTPPAGAGVRL